MKALFPYRILGALALFGSATFGRAGDTANPAEPATTQTNQPTRLPTTTVEGKTMLDEEQPIGDNQQPVWTARRRFATTRVYVQPPWQVESELTYNPTWPRQGVAQHLLRQEIELGLPYRFQIDVENNVQNFYEDDPNERGWHHDSTTFELRYALADWDVIPLNPAVNLEYSINDGTRDKYEVQLLLGEEFATRWHWGMNFFYEHQLGADLRQEYAAATALSYSLIDSKLGVGMEFQFRSESDKDSRNTPMESYDVGPSIQWRFSPRTHLDIVPLFGITGDSPQVSLFVLFGVEFGSGAKESEGIVPASLRGR